MTEWNSPERSRFPEPFAQFLADIASLYRPQTAIDPNCDDLAVLARCTFLDSKRALARNPRLLDDARDAQPDIHVDWGDITQDSLNEIFDLVTTTVIPFNYPASERSAGLDIRIADRCLDIVAPNGVCLLLVPASFLTMRRVDEFRRRVLDQMAIDAVVEIDRRVLSQYLTASLPIALLVIRNGPPRSQGTFFGQYKPGVEAKIVAAIRDGAGEFFVAPDRLFDRWDRQFHHPDHRQLERQLEGFSTQALGELATIRRGRTEVTRQTSESGEFLVLSARHILSGDFTPHERDKFLTEVDDDEILRPGDVLLSMANPSVYTYRPGDPPAVAGPTVAVIRSLQGNYIATFLRSESGASLFQKQIDRHSRGSAMQSISLADLQSLQIPILPLDDLNSISDEAIVEADESELERLRTELLRVRHLLETTEAQRDTATSELEATRSVNQENESHRQLVESQLAKILAQQSAMNSQIDLVLQALTGIREQIDVIKQSSRDDEEKLALISQQLEKWSNRSTSDANALAGYVSVVQRWLDQWDKLDPMTQQFLPSAEHLYDELERLNASDFSPFVIQYCRSLENEVLTKLFVAYHLDIKTRVSDVAAFVQSDLQNDKTGKFAHALRRDQRKHTLGDMKWVMNLMKAGGNTLNSSVLLKDFRQFTLQYFDERITEKAFLDLLQQINDEYRVKSAHPYLMGKPEADQCLKLVRRSLVDFLDSYKREIPPVSNTEP